MNPLSLLRYTVRHKGLSLITTVILVLTVVGLYLFVGVAQGTYITPAFTINRYLTRFNLVQPDQMPSLEPDVAVRLEANPDVARVLPQNDLRIKVANIGGAYFSFRLIGLRHEDVDTVLTQCGISLQEGRLPQPGTNEVALSEEIAAALELRPGDTLDRTRDEKTYPNIISPLQLVGILSGDVRLGIMSYEYLEQSESYRSLASSGLLVIPLPGHEPAVADFLRQSLRSTTTKTYTYQSVSQDVSRDQTLLYLLGLPVVLLVSIAIALVVGAINRLTFMRRLTEFGMLYAIGYQRQWLAYRLSLETAGLAVIGWVGGTLLAWGGMSILSNSVYAPRGFALDAVSPTALSFVVLVPVTVIGSTLIMATRTLARMDAIAVVEQGQLSLEGDLSGSAPRMQDGSLPKPLASMTFYRRHVRQAMVLVGATLLLIMGTALLFLVLASGSDAMQPRLNNLSHMSAVSPNNQPLDPGLIAHIRANPAVKRVIEVYSFTPVKISIPPMFPNQPIETLCVTAENMDYLVDLYHLDLAEGHLPRPNTNEVVIPWTVAKNRDIQVGDVIGDPAHPVYPNAPSLPIELVVSGIFAPTGKAAEDTWLSFMSLEFVDDYREAPLSLIVVPRAEMKAALDEWLINEISGDGRIVLTYGNQQAAFQKEMGSMLFTFTLMESIITGVAALALAGVHYLFAAGRQTELGTLLALGFTRLQLVWRVLREVLLTIVTAWLAGMAGCALVLIVLQYAVLASAGLKLNLFNPTPWLATLPIPVTVIAASAVVTTWLLSRLDPIAIIERRA